jgi:hypothetical protein
VGVKTGFEQKREPCACFAPSSSETAKLRS